MPRPPHANEQLSALRQNQGGSTHDIVDSYTLDASELGTSVNGTWALKVVDNAAQDVGTINSVTLSFSL